MSTPNLTITLQVNETPETVYNAINNVRGWWSEGVEGGTTKLNDEFVYRHKDMHYSTQKLVELVPNKKVVWLVTDSHLSFIKKHDEWTGTRVVFDITDNGGKTQLHFTHEGLTPEVACFDACSKGWSLYVKESLLALISTGEGQPDKKALAETV